MFSVLMRAGQVSVLKDKAICLKSKLLKESYSFCTVWVLSVFYVSWGQTPEVSRTSGRRAQWGNGVGTGGSGMVV